MAFRPKLYDSGRIAFIAFAASVTVTKGDAEVDNGVGYLTSAASSTAVDVHFVSMETVTTSASAGDLVEVIRTKGVIFDAGTDADPAQTDVHTEADLATVATVNPDASTNDLFYIESIVGAVADRIVRGFFLEGTPNS